MSPIAPVNTEEILAGKIRALITILYLTARKVKTPFLEESTVFVPGSAAPAIRHPYSLDFDIVGISQVGAAYVTVHTTGSNQLFIHFSQSAILPLVIWSGILYYITLD